MREHAVHGSPEIAQYARAFSAMQGSKLLKAWHPSSSTRARSQPRATAAPLRPHCSRASALVPRPPNTTPHLPNSLVLQEAHLLDLAGCLEPVLPMQGAQLKHCAVIPLEVVEVALLLAGAGLCQ